MIRKMMNALRGRLNLDRSARPKPAACRLTLEALEDRCVPATLSIADASGYEGGYAIFTVSLSAPSTQMVTVQYKTAYGSATLKDFAAQQGKLTFAPGETTKTISIALYQDYDAYFTEGVEAFGVLLSHAKGADILDGTATGFISEPPGTFP